MKNVPTMRFKDDNGRAFSAWEEKRLGDFYNFKITNSFSRDNLNYESGKVKNIHYGDIHTKFSTLFDVAKEKVPFINEDINLDKIKYESYCIEGDVVFADASEDLNDVGKSIEVVNLNGDKLLSGLHTLLARPIGDFFHIGFSGYLFKSDDVRVKIQREAQGSKVLSISATRLVNIKISVPSKPEQEKIAGFLSAIDDRISQLSQKCDGLAQYKKGVMQKIFSQELRFKDEKGRAFGAWDSVDLGNLAFKVNTKNRDDAISNVLTNSAVQGIVSQNEYFDKDIANKNNLDGYYVVEVDDFVYNPRISSSAPVGPIKRNKLVKGVMSPLYTVFRFKSGCLDFLEYFFETTYWHDHMKSVSNMGARFDRMNITNEGFFTLPIALPSLPEQAKIAGFLGAVDEKLAQAKAKLDAVKQYKQGLLQQMFV